MTSTRIPRAVIALAVLAVAGIYLLATAPPDLDESVGARDVPVATLFRLLDAENASIRKLYTGEIVTPGQKIGLKFSEDWKKKDVHAGPLPALLLRETANRLQQRVPELSLFLGSSDPIETTNKFTGAQQTYFEQIERDRRPKFFLDRSTGRQTAMFADIASAPACVTCHNGHPKSPRRDWKRDDVMGATTWSFPRDRLSTDEVIAILAAYRASALDAYDAYVRKTASFDPAARPKVGAQWPADGLFVPDAQTFRDKVEAKNSIATLNLLLDMRDGTRHDGTRHDEAVKPAPTAAAAMSRKAGTAP